MQKTMSFCFATVTSTGYVDQTAGLWLNLQAMHPGSPLVVCCLDDHAWNAFSPHIDDSLILVRASTVWGEANWVNLCARMTRPERAFATKAALAVWALEQGHEGVMVLDSDLLFEEPIPDLITDCLENQVLLVAARHNLRHWRKSNTFGLFSAGIVGFAAAGLRAARIWKAQAFDECRALPVDGLYNEQKYLDYLVGSFDVSIVRDIGINVSPSTLKLVNPRQNAQGRWEADDGTPIRVFHYSRSADSNLPFARSKVDLNRRGLEKLKAGLPVASMAERMAVKAPPFSLARIVRLMRLGAAWDALPVLLARLSRVMFTLHRVLTLPDLTLPERWDQAFRRKQALHLKLEDEAFPPK